MKQLTRDELFKKVKEARKQEKIEQESRTQGGGGNFEIATYSALGLNVEKPIRIYGNPLLVRQKPTDPKESYISMIKSDNGLKNKQFRCIWYPKQEKPDWIMWRIYDLVMSFTYSNEKDAKGNSIKIYDNFKKHPEVFKRIAKNDSDNKWETGWRPKRFVNLNIIDRQDPEFHKEHKHSKLLSKKASEMGTSGNFWFEPGIPIQAYETIWDDVVEFYDDWEEYDIVIKKLSELPWYKAYCGEDRKKLSEQTLKEVVLGPMTDEERAYELYDLDKLFPVTSYYTIMKNLGRFIKKLDIDFDTEFYLELEQLVEEEKKEREEKRKEKGYSVDVDVDVEKKHKNIDKIAREEKEKEVKKVREVREVREVAPKEEVKRTRKPIEPEKQEIDWKGLEDGTFNGTKYLGVSQMTDEEKSFVVSVNGDGSFNYIKQYKGEDYEIYLNDKSQFDAPEQFHIDPLNGDLFN